jgi:hypothetical protein
MRLLVYLVEKLMKKKTEGWTTLDQMKSDFNSVRELIADLKQEEQELAQMDKDEALCLSLMTEDLEGNRSKIESILRNYGEASKLSA